MIDLTRRGLLAGSAATAAAIAASPALAAAPAASAQAPGVYRHKIGSYEVTALYDGTWFRKIDDQYVHNASADEVNKALTAAFLQPGIVPTSFTALLVNTGSKLVLIDTGTGGQFGPTTGHMAGALAAAGVQPSAIASEVKRFRPGAEVAPGIASIAAYGHTPGHTAFAIGSGSSSMLALSDTTQHPWLFARHPHWQGVFDMDGNLAVETRKRMLDRAAAGRMLVHGYHFPFPASGYIVKTASGYDVAPVMWQPM
jgi:glyoxylase-like metal-dependent hydrolase (beta-lactamase superfamily II)